MFWKETLRLGNLPVVTKIIITLFLVLAGLGYLLGFTNIFLSYSPVDTRPGLSLADISLTFYGSRNKTALEKAIDGSMKQYFSSDSDYQEVKDWAQNGGSEETWNSDIQAIVTDSCVACHSAAAAVGGVVLEQYSDVKGLLAQDTGRSWARIVQLAHVHLLGTAPYIFILVLILSFSSFPAIIKNIVSILAFSSVLLDVGSWFLAKFSPYLSILVLIGGMSLGLSFGLLVILPLYDLWIKKQ